MKVSLVMGSISDKEVVFKCKEFLEKFGVECEVRVLSCHRSLKLLEKYVKKAEKEVKLFIAFAGKSAALPGVISALTDLPVIGVPLKSDFLDGLDSLLSIAQLPKNTGVVTSGIGKDGALNAGYFALKILALNNSSLKEKINNFKKEIEKEVAKQNTKINE